MSRYVRRHTQLGSLGPTEERRPGVWSGYDIPAVSGDLSAIGLLCVDDWPDERIAELGVTTFLRVEPDDEALYRKLGLDRRAV